ncbi:5-oxoprolinase subunit PxpA [Enterovibrio calviensis]|uniref:5-oxoprolinase subunit PxpA n=1 Tax=Enterovibrio calviensis TaxID=91359 RepID=UPI00047F9A83|nr:5-oxoprolinase subunit PxpA [Enterovibrio calviensis]
MININSDMGESYGIWKLGDDEALMPYITEANIACGFHASDPNHMQATVALAKKYNIRVGAHFSLPDLQGFGRREMKMERDELFNVIVYQVGALKSFLDMAGVPLNHLKPHGALYGMAARQSDIANAIADVALHYQVPVFGLAGTCHEQVYTDRGVTFVPEFYADLDYDENGGLIITRNHPHTDPDEAAEKCLRAVDEGKVKTVNGNWVNATVNTICVHSDTPNAADVARAVRAKLGDRVVSPSQEHTQ